MIRILFFLIVVFALGLGFAWLADRPGDMVVTFSGYQYQVSLMVAAVAVTAVVAAVMILWWLVKAIWNSPYTISRYFRVRRRDRGYQALSTGMIAAGAGDGALARKMNKQAAKLINAQTEPLIQLLDAQASLLEGDHETAREQVRSDARRSRNAAARPARALSRGRAARRPHRGAPLCRPRGRSRAATCLGGQCDHRGADRARRLGRRAEAGRKPEGDAADRARGGQPPPRRAADRQGAGAVRHRPCGVAQRRARGQQAAAGLRAGCGRRRQGAVQAERYAQGRQDPRSRVAGGAASGCRRRSTSMRGRATPSTTGWRGRASCSR